MFGIYTMYIKIHISGQSHMMKFFPSSDDLKVLCFVKYAIKSQVLMFIRATNYGLEIDHA